MKVRWHKSNGNFVAVTMVEDGEDVALIKHGAKEYAVPRHQLYTMDDPPQSLAPVPDAVREPVASPEPEPSSEPSPDPGE